MWYSSSYHQTYGSLYPTVRLEVLDHARLLWVPDAMRSAR